MTQHILNLAHFNDVLKAKYVIVDFYATWCGPCKMIAPFVEQKATENRHVKTVKVDVDQCKDVSSKYRVSSMPTFMLFINGVEQLRFSGANRDKIIQMYSMCKADSPFKGVGHRIGGATTSSVLNTQTNNEQQKNVLITVVAIGGIVGVLFLIKFLMG